MSRRRITTIAIACGVLLVGGLVGVVLATSGGTSKEDLVIYTARSHYGEEQPFKDFAASGGHDLTLFGGDASSLFERLKSEGDNTKADVLITVDAANLWRAKEEGLLLSVNDPELGRNVPADVRDEEGFWIGLTNRARTIMRSTERVKPSDVTTYAGLGDPRWRGKLCLRTSSSDYNTSFVADRIAKDGREPTKRMLERWMANEPDILGSDVDVLKAIEAGRCDAGLTNSYYLGRELKEDENFPVAPVWADQDGRGTHVNVSGLAVVKATDSKDTAVELLRFLTTEQQQELFAKNNEEFPADPDVPAAPEIAQFGKFKRDPIDVDGAGENLDDAVKLMNEVGWD